MISYNTDFCSYLSDVKKVSANTKASYLRDIACFEERLADIPLRGPQEATPEQIRLFYSGLLESGKSQATVMRIASAVKCYYNFLLSEGKVRVSPAKGISPAHRIKRTPEILSSDEVELLLSQPDTKDFKGCRDKAMLELLYATGIRVSELMQLCMSDVFLNINHIRCGAAESKRMLPVYPVAAKALKHYIESARPAIVLTEAQDALFVNLSGERMTRQGFWKIIKQYAARADIRKEITPHTLRHSFAVHLIENGAEISALQKMMGHADISSTQVYARIIKDRTEAEYFKCHPRAAAIR